MDPSLIALVVRGAFRLGNAGKLAFEQHARNKAVLLPDTFVGSLSDREKLIELVMDHFDELCAPGKPYAAYWAGTAPAKDANGDDSASLAYLKAGLIELNAMKQAQTSHLPERDAEVVVGVELVAQWRKGEGPPHPWVHIAVTLVDLGLEFVAAKPELIGLNGNGAKIVGSIAGSLETLIPNDTSQFDIKAVFGERLIAAFLKGALQGVSQNADSIFREKHLQELVTRSLEPLIVDVKKIEADPDIDTEDWMSLVETLTGPSAQAAIGVLADHPVEFFGRKFDSEKAVGGLTQAMLREAAKRPLSDNFSEAGLLALFKASLRFGIARPDLIMGTPDGAADKFKLDIFVRVLTAVEKADNPFSGDVLLGIAAAGLDAFKGNAAALFGADDDWDEVVTAAVGMVTDGLKDGYLRKDGKGLEDIFGREKLIELGRVFLVQVSLTPGMIAGTVPDGQGGSRRNQEIRKVVAAIAKAMAADEKLLLSGDDWILIAGAAMAQAAANPGPLFGLDDAQPEDAIALGAIQTLLRIAGDSIDSAKRQQGDMLFGATLRDAIVGTLERLPRNLALLAQPNGMTKLSALVKETADYVENNEGRVGSSQFLKLYLYNLDLFLNEGQFQFPDESKIKKLLGGS